MFNISIIAGSLLALSVLSLLSTANGFLPAYVPGLLQGLSGLLLWRDVPVGVRRLSLFLAAIGIACLAVSSQSFPLSALGKNQQITGMLVAIGLLRKIPLAKTLGEQPRGSKAFWQTLSTLNLFAAVINISALAIFAERITSESEGRLEIFQGIFLARAFAMASMWSPMFIAMGVALVYAPGADYRVLMLWGLPFSLLLLMGMTFLAIHRYRDEVSRFVGYPFYPQALAGPIILAGLILAGHLLFPPISIVLMITILTPIYAIAVNMRNKPLKMLVQYVSSDLPRMGSEVVLFFTAGILGAGMSALFEGTALTIGPENNSLLLVMVGLALIIVLSAVGVHPVVGITIVGGSLVAAEIPANLLAMCFLMSWGLGVLINPISGLHLLLSGRYALPSRSVWRWNWSFVLTAYAIGCLWLSVAARFWSY